MMKKCLAFVLSLSVIGNSLFLGNVEAKVEKETLSHKSYQIKSMIKNIPFGNLLFLPLCFLCVLFGVKNHKFAKQCKAEKDKREKAEEQCKAEKDKCAKAEEQYNAEKKQRKKAEEQCKAEKDKCSKTEEQREEAEEKYKEAEEKYKEAEEKYNAEKKQREEAEKRCKTKKCELIIDLSDNCVNALLLIFENIHHRIINLNAYDSINYLSNTVLFYLDENIIYGDCDISKRKLQGLSESGYKNFNNILGLVNKINEKIVQNNIFYDCFYRLYRKLYELNLIIEIQKMEESTKLSEEEKNELKNYLNFLFTNSKFETYNKLLGYLFTGKYKEAYKDFINNFNDEGIGEKIKVDLSDGLLCELEQKLKNIRNNYSTENSEGIFAWVHQNIIKSKNTIDSKHDSDKITIENFNGDKDRIKKLFKTIATLSSKLGGTNDKNLQALSCEFNVIKNIVYKYYV